MSRRVALAALIGCVVVAFNLHRADAQRRTPVTVTRLYTGSDGQTHSETVDIKLMPPSGGGEQSGPLVATGMQFRRFPPGWVNDWHTAPQRQYVITLSGRSEVEMAGGKKFVNNPGQVVFADDLTGKGHITRTLGTEDWISVAVPVPDK
jgi:hypothetical protein